MFSRVALRSKSAFGSIRKCSTETLQKTAFYDLHLSLGGKMVPFAGYSLPVQYEGLGVLKEHLHTRSATGAALFDVSHMGQIKWTGKDAVAFLEKMTVCDVASLKVGEAKLSLVMNEKGTIMDDTVITNAGDHIYMVVNGACKWKDMEHFRHYMKSTGMDVNLEYLGDQQLLALQGKGAVNVVKKLVPGIDFQKMNFMTGTMATVAGIPDCRITRCGYTGEDGFEISVSQNRAMDLANALMEYPEVKPAGLGARDSLRLEAGLCLYGNDLDETINPVEGALTWTIGGPKSRRRLEQGFLGADKFLEENGKLKAVAKKRVGIAGMKAPARGHTEIFNADGSAKIGEITSGGFGPTLNKPVAMGFVETAHSKEGTVVQLNVRGKMLPAQITKTPFVQTSYYKAP